MIEQSKLESAIHHYLVLGLIDDGFAPDIGWLNAIPTGAVRGPDVFFRWPISEPARCLNRRVSLGCTNHARHERPMRRGYFPCSRRNHLSCALAGLP